MVAQSLLSWGLRFGLYLERILASDYEASGLASPLSTVQREDPSQSMFMASPQILRRMFLFKIIVFIKAIRIFPQSKFGQKKQKI